MGIDSTQNYTSTFTINWSTDSNNNNNNVMLSQQNNSPTPQPTEIVPSFNWIQTQADGKQNIIEGKICALHQYAKKEQDSYAKTSQLSLKAKLVYYFVIKLIESIQNRSLSVLIHSSDVEVVYESEVIPAYYSNYLQLTKNESEVNVLAIKIKFSKLEKQTAQLTLKIHAENENLDYLSTPFTLSKLEASKKALFNLNNLGETIDLCWYRLDSKGNKVIAFTTKFTTKYRSTQAEITHSRTLHKKLLISCKHYVVIFSEGDWSSHSWTCYIKNKKNENKQIPFEIDVVEQTDSPGKKWALNLKLDARMKFKRNFFTCTEENPVCLVLKSDDTTEELESDPFFIFSESCRLTDFVKKANPSAIRPEKIEPSCDSSILSDSLPPLLEVNDNDENDKTDSDRDISNKESPKNPISKRRKSKENQELIALDDPGLQPIFSPETSESSIGGYELNWRNSNNNSLTGKIYGLEGEPLRKDSSNKLILVNGQSYYLALQTNDAISWSCIIYDTYLNEQTLVSHLCDNKSSDQYNFVLEVKINLTKKFVDKSDGNKFYIRLEANGETLLSEEILIYSNSNQRQSHKRTSTDDEVDFSILDMDDASEDDLDYESDENINTSASKKSKKTKKSKDHIAYPEYGSVQNEIPLTWIIKAHSSIISGRLRPIGVDMTEKDAFNQSKQICLVGSKQYYIILPKNFQGKNFKWETLLESEDETRTITVREDENAYKKKMIKAGEYALRLTLDTKKSRLYSTAAQQKEVHFRLHQKNKIDDSNDLVSGNFFIFSSSQKLTEYRNRQNQDDVTMEEIDEFSFIESESRNNATSFSRVLPASQDEDCMIISPTTTSTTTTTTSTTLPLPATQSATPTATTLLSNTNIQISATINPTPTLTAQQTKNNVMSTAVEKVGSEFLWYRGQDNTDELTGRIGQYFSNNIKTDKKPLIEDAEMYAEKTVLVNESEYFISLPKSENREWNCFVVNSSGDRIPITLDKTLPAPQVRKRYYDAAKEDFTRPKIKLPETSSLYSTVDKLEPVNFLFESKDGIATKTIRSAEFLIFSTYQNLEAYVNTQKSGM